MTSSSSHANNPRSAHPMSPHNIPVPLSPIPSSTPTTFDMKRLLAKPAPPYSRSYTYAGSGSESEGFSDSPRRITVPDGGFVSPPKECPSNAGRSRSVQSLSSQKDLLTSAPPKEKRQRNVLRRRPSQTQKSAPAHPLPTTSNTNATFFPSSPLPVLSPRSPLSPSLLPSLSPASSSTSLPRGSSPRPTTAPGQSPATPTFARSVSSLDKPLPVLPASREENHARPSGYGAAQPRRERSKEWRPRMEEGDNWCVVNVTDEKGDCIDVRARLRQLKGHPFPSSSSSHSPSPSRSHSPSADLHYPSISSRSRSASRNPTTSTSADPSLPSANLTPAAAVVAAYKRQNHLQDRRTASGFRSSSVDTSASMSGLSRLSFSAEQGFAAIERLASESQDGHSQPQGTTLHEKGKSKERENDAAKRNARRLPHTSAGHTKATSQDQDEEDDEGKHQPYYTVFGSSLGRVIAVGGPEDQRLSWEFMGPAPLSRKESTGGLKGLTRKVSGRFKRGGAQSEGEEKDRGRPSLQQDSRPGTSRSGERVMVTGRSLRLSIDKFPDETVAQRVEKERDAPKKSPGSATASTPSPNSSSGGSRIWKLMKRISSGGLRDRYNANDEPPPPVPSLPKEYALPTRPPIQMFEEKDGREVAGSPIVAGFGQAVRKKASLVLGVNAGGSPTKKKTSFPRSPLASPTPAPQVRAPPAAPRPSTTTRSSSPISSDVASARFFASPGYKQSAHSSTSSLFDDPSPPPLPMTKHIVPPKELGKMDESHGASSEDVDSSTPTGGKTSPTLMASRGQLTRLKVMVPAVSILPSPEKTSSKSDDYIRAFTPATEIASLPLPPRRPGQPLGRMRRDTNTPTFADAGFAERQQEHKEKMKDTVLKEVEGDGDGLSDVMLEWERLWGGVGNLENRDNKDDVDSRSGSPIIPTFSTADPINAFAPKRASSKVSPSHHHPSSLDEMGNSPAESLPPPPRPPRAPHRPASISTSTSAVKAPPMSPRTASLSMIPASPKRRSTGGHSVASTLTITNGSANSHRRRRSSSFLSNVTSLGSPSSPPSMPMSSSLTPPHRTMTFRELGKSGVALTEQEKAARWDDLLERSAKAGGTLHLDYGNGLRSDRMRFSDISEMTGL